MNTTAPAKPAGARRRAAVDRVVVCQIHYAPWQQSRLDPAFSPFDNGGTVSEWREFDVFERLHARFGDADDLLWGAVSWRFGEKTGMAGADYLAAIRAQPGYDVYYCNPYPHLEALYHNLWMQGETAHPDFLALSRAVLAAAGLPASTTLAMLPSHRFSSANYFVARPRFWQAYLAFVRGVLAAAERALPPPLRAQLHSPGADPRRLHGGATYLPFIVERLFAPFVQQAGASLRACRIALPARDARLNAHLRLLREMKDVAHATRSPWLAACWANYRNLYLRQSNGAAWCKRYLGVLTPADIVFG